MKNSIPYIILFFFFITASFVNAQTVKFTAVLDNSQCYKKSDFPTLLLATQQFLKDGLGYSTCTNGDCPFPDYASCVAGLVEGEEVKETSTEWCFVGTLLFEWVCETGELEPEPGNGNESDSGGGNDTKGDPERHEKDNERREERGQKFNPASLELAANTDSQTSTHIQKIYPNPSAGIFTLDISLNPATTEVTLIISDWMGRQIRQKTHQPEGQSVLRTVVDLSDAMSGIYFASILVDGVIVETNKFTIQD